MVKPKWILTGLAIAAVLGIAAGLLVVRGCRHGRGGSGVPRDFSGLPTDSTDYTCAGSVPCATWPMPLQPAAGAGSTDPTYGTTTYRLAVPANSSTGTVIPAYSRVQAFNSDDSLLMMSDGVQTDLYDATVTPPRPISQIKVSDGTNIDGISGDALWANTDPKRIYFNSPSGSAHGMELRYVDVSSCTVQSCVLAPVVVHKFACMTDAYSSLGAGVNGNKIETGSGGQGGMFDQSDTYFTLACDYVNGNGRNAIDLIRYNRLTDSVTTQIRWYQLCPDATPSTCKVIQTLPKGNNVLRLSQHPDQHYISIIWQSSSSVCPTAESKWTRSCGTEVFDENFRFLGPVNSYSGHQDWGFDVNGEPVFVGSSNSATARDYRALEIVDLKNLDPTKIVAKHVLLPCSFSYIGAGCDSGTYVGYAKSWHVSMTAWPRAPGYALFSTFILAGQSAGAPRMPAATTLGTAVAATGSATVSPANMATIGPGVLSLVDYGTPNWEMVTWTATTATTATANFFKPHPATASVQCMSCGSTGFGAMELLALRIDASAPDWSNFSFYRIARTHAVRDANYNCEAHATVNRGFTAMVWGSSWDGPCDTNAQVTGYYLALKAATPPEPQPGVPQCTLKLDSTGKTIEDIHCVNLPLTDNGARTASRR